MAVDQIHSKQNRFREGKRSGENFHTPLSHVENGIVQQWKRKAGKGDSSIWLKNPRVLQATNGDTWADYIHGVILDVAMEDGGENPKHGDANNTTDAGSAGIAEAQGTPHGDRQTHEAQGTTSIACAADYRPSVPIWKTPIQLETSIARSLLSVKLGTTPHAAHAQPGRALEVAGASGDGP